MSGAASATPTPTPTPAWREHAAYALLRGGFGLLLMTHGLPKLLGTAHGSMADPMGGSIRLIEHTLHLPAAPLLAALVALLEAGGGLLLALGAGTRTVAALVTVQMIAICIALGPTWVWIDRGIEFPALMALLALYLAVRGDGAWSLAAAWRRRRRGGGQVG